MHLSAVLAQPPGRSAPRAAQGPALMPRAPSSFPSWTPSPQAAACRHKQGTSGSARARLECAGVRACPSEPGRVLRACPCMLQTTPGTCLWGGAAPHHNLLLLQVHVERLHACAGHAGVLGPCRMQPSSPRVHHCAHNTGPAAAARLHARGSSRERAGLRARCHARWLRSPSSLPRMRFTAPTHPSHIMSTRSVTCRACQRRRRRMGSRVRGLHGVRAVQRRKPLQQHAPPPACCRV